MTIRTPSDVASTLGMQLDLLRGIEDGAKYSYRRYRKAKATGGSRLISEPNPLLKEVQWLILYRVFPKLLHRQSRAVQRDPVLNARAHVDGIFIATLDLKDAFPSTKRRTVEVALQEAGLTRPASQLVAGLCTDLGALPQGSPTSNQLLDLVLSDIDRAMTRSAKRCRARYTRFADNFTLSGPSDLTPLIKELISRVEEVGYDIPAGKVQMVDSTQSIEVTGVRIINGRTRSTARAVEAALARLREWKDDRSDRSLRRARGHINWIRRIDPEEVLRLANAVAEDGVSDPPRH